MIQDIQIYLRSAFRDLDVFSILNVGTFRKLYRAAELIDQDNRLHPPKVEIEFITEILKDRLLNHYLVENIHLNPDQADAISQKITEEILKDIDSSGIFKIDYVGALRKDGDGKLYFVPLEGENDFFAKPYYGLQTLALQERNSQMSFESEEIMSETESPEDFSPSRSDKLNWMPIVLMISFMALTVMVIMERPQVISRVPYAQQTDNGEEQLADNNITLQNEPEALSTETVGYLEEGPAIISAKDIEKTIILDEDESQAELPAIASNEGPKVDRVEENTSTYRQDLEVSDLAELDTISSTQLIASRGVDAAESDGSLAFHYIYGSFATRKSAEAFARKMRNESWNAQVLAPKVGMNLNYRVSIYSTSNQEQITQFVEKMRRLDIDSGWIYTEVLKQR